ncbi:MAG: hypothetical protein LUD77_12025 [Clostridiales bacterium]|nr:hypothetical protein [Clostridiales bacterium]
MGDFWGLFLGIIWGLLKQKTLKFKANICKNTQIKTDKKAKKTLKYAVLNHCATFRANGLS